MLLLTSLFALAQSTDLETALGRLLSAPLAEREQAIDTVLAASPTTRDLIERLAQPLAPIGGPQTTDGWSLCEATDELGVVRPYQLFVPAEVLASDAPVQLIVHMHGAVARPEFTTELSSGLGYGPLHWPPEAAENNWVIAFPLGSADVPWWSPAGVANIRAVVRDVQRRLPIDHESIVGAGFSDGASACYYLAMTGPAPFAALVPMNGHPRVASSASGQQLYPENLASIPMFAAMTQDDVLYPAKAVLPHLQAALEAGAQLHIASYPFGNHQPIYFDEQRTTFVRFMTEARRDYAEPKLGWFSAHDEHAERAWLTILERGSNPADAALPELAKVTTMPGRLRLGINADPRVTDGVGIASVTEASLAEALGLRRGDRLVELVGFETPDVGTLGEVLSRLERGQTVTARAERAGAMIDLEAQVPIFVATSAYGRDLATSWVRTSFEGDRLDVESHGVRKLQIDLLKELFGSGDVHVHWNGEHVDVEPQQKSARELLRDWAARPGRAALFSRTLELGSSESR